MLAHLRDWCLTALGLAALAVFVALALPLALCCDRHGLRRAWDSRPGPGEEWL